MKQIIYRRAAIDELRDAVLWYEEHRPGLGNELLDEVMDRLQDVVRAPQRFAIEYRNVRSALLRKFPYSIYFVNKRSVVEIVSVFHHGRDPTTWHRRL